MKQGLLVGGKSLGMLAHLPNLIGAWQSERGLWLGWKYVHAGGVHDMCVILEYTTDDDKT